MANDEWRQSTLGDIAQAEYGLVDGPFGSNLPASEYVPSGVPVIRGSNLSLGGLRFNEDAFVYVSEAFAQGLARSLCVPGDIIFTKKGTLGQTGIIPASSRFHKFLLSSNQMKLSVDPTKADPLFVYYFVSSPISQEKIIQDSTVTGVPKTNLAYLRDFPILVPPLEQQKAIARIVGTLDDKIELNLKLNEAMESMTQALFKSWFVDFDPVRAKAEGRDTGLPVHVAALFPDSFADSELGEIPTSWTVKRIGDLVELAYGKALKEVDRRHGNVAVYGSNGQIGWHDEKLVGGPGIIVGRKGNPGIVTWVPIDFFAIDTTFYVVPRTECKSLYFLFYALKGHDLASLGADSAVPGLNRNMAYLSKQLVPPSTLLEAFDQQIRPLFERIQKGKLESSSLAKMREALLPKLISGEIRLATSDRNERESD